MQSKVSFTLTLYSSRLNCLLILYGIRSIDLYSDDGYVDVGLTVNCEKSLCFSYEPPLIRSTPRWDSTGSAACMTFYNTAVDGSNSNELFGLEYHKLILTNTCPVKQ